MFTILNWLLDVTACAPKNKDMYLYNKGLANFNFVIEHCSFCLHQIHIV